ncbi:MAG: Lrp/AsnC family transcriptional regulator [Pirellulales bacterium]|nr:Lrp/AsnC family transcriptional regulator [Pirellulales bacterium]
MRLDRIDFGLISMLRENARISNKELAERNGISPSTCLERVRRLTDGGVLTGFHAAVDSKAIGIGVQAMIAVRHAQHEPLSFERLRDDLLKVPVVVAVYFLAGTRDYLVHVATRDVDHLRETCEQFSSRSEVGHIETSLILDYERSTTLPNYLEE